MKKQLYFYKSTRIICLMNIFLFAFINILVWLPIFNDTFSFFTGPDEPSGIGIHNMMMSLIDFNNFSILVPLMLSLLSLITAIYLLFIKKENKIIRSIEIINELLLIVTFMVFTYEITIECLTPMNSSIRW